MANVVYLNGEFVPEQEAKVSVYDGGFLHGAGLFETMRADFGHVFRLDAHLDRMLSSAEKLGLPVERPDLPLTKDFDELICQNELNTARIRMTVTIGSMLAVPTEKSEKPALTVCVTATDLPPYPGDFVEHGMRVMITPFTQSETDPMAGHKTIDYLPRILALRSARKFGCHEALWFTPRNYLAEGCISSVFVAKGGALTTPPLNTPVLPGVSRAVVLELAAELGIKAEEAQVDINGLLDADEVFLTSSSMQVMPVCNVEKKEIGTGKPGPIVAQLRQAFQEKVERECNLD